MDWMDFHLFVACAVYATGAMVAWIYLMVTIVNLCDEKYRARLKRKILRFIRNILRKIMKVES